MPTQCPSCGATCPDGSRFGNRCGAACIPAEPAPSSAPVYGVRPDTLPGDPAPRSHTAPSEVGWRPPSPIRIGYTEPSGAAAQPSVLWRPPSAAPSPFALLGILILMVLMAAVGSPLLLVANDVIRGKAVIGEIVFGAIALSLEAILLAALLRLWASVGPSSAAHKGVCDSGAFEFGMKLRLPLVIQ